jgi:hypothetical protein
MMKEPWGEGAMGCRTRCISCFQLYSDQSRLIFGLHVVSCGSSRCPLDLGKPDLCCFNLVFEYIRIDQKYFTGSVLMI